MDPRTKIVATLGPACAGETTLAQLVAGGADVFRLNGAHARAEGFPAWVERVRAAARRAGRPASVWVDLPGTKLRTGSFSAGRVRLAAGQRVRLMPGRFRGDTERIPVRGLPDLTAAGPGSPVLLADGRIRLRVLRRRTPGLSCEVVDGGWIEAGKGVAFPGTRLPTRVPTRRDRALARAAVAAGADGVALSFVREAAEVHRLRRLLAAEGAPDLPVVVKVEREDAVGALDPILTEASAAIVARGDLGVDVGPERVPTLQKRIIEAAGRHGRPVIVATEMLESMVEAARPTRAEAGDVANAVFEGADGVMLSAETAVGRHPSLVVRTMARILLAAEADAHAPYAGRAGFRGPAHLSGRPDQHVVRAAVGLAAETGAEAIVVFTRTGASAVRLSKERPGCPVFAYAPTDEVCRRLTLAWGVRPRRLPMAEGMDALVARMIDALRHHEGLAAGARAVLVMGAARDPAGTTTLVQLLTL